jgi:uncharacterized membrane protein YsdA (DUF1294 family)
MGALVVAVVVTLVGGGIGVVLASRFSNHRGGDPRGRIARRVVVMLGGTAGALIASQLYSLVHELQLDSRFAKEPAFHSAVTAELKRFAKGLEESTLTGVLRNVIFSGLLLIGLTVAVELIAIRRGAGPDMQAGS